MSLLTSARFHADLPITTMFSGLGNELQFGKDVDLFAVDPG